VDSVGQAFQHAPSHAANQIVVLVRPVNASGGGGVTLEQFGGPAGSGFLVEDVVPVREALVNQLGEQAVVDCAAHRLTSSFGATLPAIR
jgi:hypothetical protein